MLFFVVQAVPMMMKKRKVVVNRFSHQMWRKSKCTTTYIPKGWSLSNWALHHLLTW